jgi:hypothetical protein
MQGTGRYRDGACLRAPNLQGRPESFQFSTDEVKAHLDDETAAG